MKKFYHAAIILSLFFLPSTIFASPSSEFRIRINTVDVDDGVVEDVDKNVGRVGRSGQFKRAHGRLVERVASLISPPSLSSDQEVASRVEQVGPTFRLVWNAPEEGKQRTMEIKIPRQLSPGIASLDIKPVAFEPPYAPDVIDGIIYHISAYDQDGREIFEFDDPFMLTLSIPADFKQREIGIFYFDDEKKIWTRLESDLVGDNAVTFGINRLSLFGMMSFIKGMVVPAGLTPESGKGDISQFGATEARRTREIAEIIVYTLYAITIFLTLITARVLSKYVPSHRFHVFR